MDNQKLINVADFSPEELRKWQLKLLEILVYFRDFCEENNLRFFLASGTCIGAVRHHGFIPWDDDVDVQMLREDYERLIKIWNEKADTSRFVCCVSSKNTLSGFPMATIRSVNTTCIYNHSVNEDICHGLKIDVEFLDAVPTGKFAYKIHETSEGFLGLFRTQRVPERVFLSKRIWIKLLFFLFPTRKLKWRMSNLFEKIVTRYNPPKKDGMIRYLLCRPKFASDYSDVVWMDFEGYKMPVPFGYDRFLTIAYGDYMQLPPEDKRKPVTANLVFYDLDHSYLDYKGKYYCVNKK